MNGENLAYRTKIVFLSNVRLSIRRLGLPINAV